MQNVRASRLSKAKTKKSKPAKGCLCHPAPKQLYPVSDHAASCPISKRYTTNGRIIADMLHTEKIRGNPKDYVILSGASLMDFDGTYEMRHDGGSLSVPSVHLVHKRRLHNIIGAKQAARFWVPGIGRRHGK